GRRTGVRRHRHRLAVRQQRSREAGRRRRSRPVPRRPHRPRTDVAGWDDVAVLPEPDPLTDAEKRELNESLARLRPTIRNLTLISVAGAVVLVLIAPLTTVVLYVVLAAIAMSAFALRQRRIER